MSIFFRIKILIFLNCQLAVTCVQIYGIEKLDKLIESALFTHKIVCITQNKVISADQVHQGKLNWLTLGCIGNIGAFDFILKDICLLNEARPR